MPGTPGGTSGNFGLSTGPKQCTAMSKRSGKQCQGPAVLGSPNQKCRMHGGHGGHAIGPNNTQYKHGRHSRYLPAKLAALYEQALSNPDLIEMNDHIALLESHLQDTLQTSAEGEPVPRWSEVAEAFTAIETAILSGKTEDIVPGLEKMHALIDAGDKWDRTWDRVQMVMEQLRKMTDTEVKRRKELNQMVSIERVTILMGAVGEAVKRNVTNPLEVDKVYREIATLFGGENKTPGGRTLAPNNVIDVEA